MKLLAEEEVLKWQKYPRANAKQQPGYCHTNQKAKRQTIMGLLSASWSSTRWLLWQQLNLAQDWNECQKPEHNDTDEGHAVGSSGLWPDSGKAAQQTW